MNDVLFMFTCFVLFGLGVGMLAYKLGFAQGHDEGWVVGSNAEREQWPAKLIQAKREGAKTARVLAEIKYREEEAA